MKRLCDLILSILLLPVVLPLCLAVATVLLCEGAGPVLYHSRRIGRSGKPFTMMKFRTMYPDGDARLGAAERAELERCFKLPNDPRVTPLGRWLRRTTLDELPQLLNVFRGEMSMVGPRPKLPGEISLFGDRARELLSVRPGITGHWQVHRSTARSDAAMVAMEIEYVRTRSFLGDLAILVHTPWRIFAADNG